MEKISQIHYKDSLYSINLNEENEIVLYDERGIKCRNKDIKFEIMSAALINALYKVEYLEKFRNRTHLIFEDFDSFGGFVDNIFDALRDKLHDLDYEIEDCCRIEVEDKEYE